MRKLYFLLAILCTQHSFGQLTQAPDGGNKKAWIGERIGITDVSIQYDRPAVKGREGKVWGALVPYGFSDLGFGTSKRAPWRAGANENTVISFSEDVKVEGKDLPAGKYGFHIAFYPDQCTLIFSRNYTSWGSFFYDSTEDVLRVPVKQLAQDKSTEWLKYEFEDEKPNSATIALYWEKWKIPFTVSVDYVSQQLASYRRELRTDKGFNSDAWVQAAQFCLQNNTNLQEALQWSDYAINGVFVGETNFATLTTKAQVLERLGKTTEADALMKQALPMGNEVQIHNYARQLLKQKKTKEAFEAFKMNYDKHPDNFTTNMGMTRAYSATGNYKEALKYAQKALLQAPDPGNKVSVEKVVEMLKEGKDNVN
ncbi:DUF2911 domain-containing protein [Foetidibacter luteolus]|uniref:DUF2911 domain-containing protein n=1 Tax=Foetidibacter luteolus TaxID=2608880 RepID=UPI00129BF46A|nr:DUF2911 domain-containing protein [Foetidibacter luteolus]